MISFFQIFVLAFAIFALSRVILRLREGQISLLETSFWFIIWVGISSLVFFPKPAVFISDILGIGRAADLMVYLAVISLFYLVFRIYVKIVTMDHKMTQLVREIAIQKEENKNKKKIRNKPVKPIQ